jgi:ATP-dependent Clp protease ATP-binding subunit ClpC
MRTNLDSKIFDRLSENAIISLRNAAQISSQFNSNGIEPGHIFVGILLNKKSLAGRIFSIMGFSISSLLKNFSDFVGVTIDARTSKAPMKLNFSKESADIIREAFRLSNQMSHVYVGSEHLVLSILKDKKLNFVRKLRKEGLDFQSYYDALLGNATYPEGLLMKSSRENGSNASYESALSSLAYDLVESAKKGDLDPLIGRDKELDMVVRILSRRRKNNPVVIGEAGVGKTALIEGLAQRIAKGNVPPPLLNMRIFSLDISAIIASSKLRGDIEEKILAIVKEVTSSDNIILFIDEIHSILASNLPGSGVDIASVLKPALLRDRFRCIGATTVESYTQYFEEDSALARRFQPVKLDEPSISESEKILKQIKKLIEKHQKVTITEEAIKAAVYLSDRYVSERYLPDKAIDLLDEAAATRRMELESRYKDISKYYMKYKDIITKKREAVLQGDLDLAKKLKKQEDALKVKIDKMEKSRAKETKKTLVEVGVSEVRKVISEWTGIPITTLDISESKKLSRLEKILSKSIIGQREAVNSVASAVKRARAGISSPNRPWASFLFLGPTGVGKTEMAKVLTKEVFGDVDRLVQIDMSEMMEMHSVSKLIGSPPGYVGYREGGQLTEIVRQNPHSVILFDEIEKAHDEVLNILLQILESGHLTDGKGRRVNFKNTIIILTSNIGAQEIREDRVLGFVKEEKLKEKNSDVEDAYEAMKSDLVRILKATLKPELINRLDDIVIFRSLTRKDARDIVKLLIMELNERLSEKGICVNVSKEAVNYLLKDSFNSEYGARPLRRAIQDEIETKLAEWILENNVADLDAVGKFRELNFVFSKGKILISEK